MADQAEINGACLLLLAPALWGPVPNGIAQTLPRLLPCAHCIFAVSARAFPPALYGPLVPVYPPGPPHPRSGLSQATTSPSWFFCPARTEPVVPLLSQTPAALHLRGTQSSKISAAAREEEASLRSCICIVAFHQTTYGPPHLLPTHPCLPPFDTVACRSLALFPPFCLLFFFFQPPNHQTVDRLATGPTSQPKHRMSGSHKAHDHHHHPPLC